MFRLYNIVGFALCVVALLAALIMQYGFHLEPCPLCSLSRVALIGAGIGFVITAIINPQRLRWLYSVGTSLFIGCGIALNIRHLWIQNLPPDQIPACGPSLDYLLSTLPLGQALQIVLTGGGECAEVAATFLGLSLPAWTLILFVGLLVICYTPYIKKG